MTTDSFDGSEAARAAWSLFAAFERRDCSMTTALVEQYGAETLLLGMGAVCARLRHALREHAVECYCGSDAWLEQELIHLAEGGS
jgi:hypothetical protein